MSTPFKLLQVCNVGEICGGTAACAWTICRALQGAEHEVFFFSRIRPETRTAFESVRGSTRSVSRVTDEMIRDSQADLVLFHNTSPDRAERPGFVPSISYVHSVGKRMDADVTIACSRWLASKLPRDGCPVLYQPVPIPPAQKEVRRGLLGDSLTIGRICTPQPRKWPESLIPFYRRLAERFPAVSWEFVGAPSNLQAKLAEACRGQARFWPADWAARGHLHRWHALLYHHPDLTESFGRTVAEAMRCGTIPIVDDQGGFIEQIDSAKTGFLCPNADAFESALETIQDPAIRWAIGHAAKRSAEERCSLRHFADRLRNVLT